MTIRPHTGQGKDEMEQLLALPRLNEPELRSLFGDDERAVWRYQVLAALLHEHRTARDVARSFNTTPETIRALRTQFQAQGTLDVLLSKRRGAAGHVGRQSPLAQAVATELAADPTASAGAVWRRVHAQLAPRGIEVPRRSIYRLVERLRPAPDAALAAPAPDIWPPALVPHVRAALPLLLFDPPLDLGRSVLAELLLPNESDALMRGRTLHTLLSAALEQLRPGPHVPPTDPSCRPYQVLVGEALQGQGRDELEAALAIAPATYTRAKRQGLERLAELVVDEVLHQRQRTTVSAPPPAPPLFGRGRERHAYTARLEHEGMAVIWGMAGSGKTALAATLAAQYQAQNEHVVWHCCSGTGDMVLRQLLRAYGDTRGGAGLDTNGLLDALRSRCMRGGVLVLDDFHEIVDDAATTLVLALLRGLVQRQRLRLIIVTRTLPRWADNNGWLPLGGLAADQARAWWNLLHNTGGADAADWNMIYAQSLGYPALLQMDGQDAVVSFVNDAMCSGLTRAAQELLSKMLLSRHPLENIACSDDTSDGSPHRELQRRGLITYHAKSGCYHLHGIVQAHRSALAARIPHARSTLLALCHEAQHQHAWLDAAAYALHAGDVSVAVAIVEAHIHELVAQRQGNATRDMLQQALTYLPPGMELATVQAHLGIVHLALGAYEDAIGALRTALELAATFGDRFLGGESRYWSRLLAEAYLEAGQWQHALSYAQSSMASERAISADVSPIERCALTLLQHRIWLQAGHPQHARFWLADAQTQALASGCVQSAVLVAYAEGLDHMRAGLFARAAERLRWALRTLPPGMHDRERCAIVSALAHCLITLCEFNDAHALIQQYSYTIYVLGHGSGFAQLTLARAHCALALGMPDEARALLSLATTLTDPLNRLLSAELHHMQGWLAVHDGNEEYAVQCCAAAIAAISEPPIPALQAECMLSLSLLCWQQGDSATATQYADHVQRLADQAQLERPRALAALCLAREALQRGAWADMQGYLDTAASASDDPLLYHFRQRLALRLHAATGVASEAAQHMQRTGQNAQRAQGLLQHLLDDDR